MVILGVLVGGMVVAHVPADLQARPVGRLDLHHAQWNASRWSNQERVLDQDPGLGFPAAAGFGLAVGSFLNVVILRLPKRLEWEWRATAARCSASRSCTIRRRRASSSNARTARIASIRSPGAKTSRSSAGWYCAGAAVIAMRRFRAVPAGRTADVLLVRRRACGASASAGSGFGAVLFYLFPDRRWRASTCARSCCRTSSRCRCCGSGLIAQHRGLYVAQKPRCVGAMVGYLVAVVGVLAVQAAHRQGRHGPRRLQAAGGARRMGGLRASCRRSCCRRWSARSSARSGWRMKGRDRATPIPFGPYLAVAGWIAFFWAIRCRCLPAPASPRSEVTADGRRRPPGVRDRPDRRRRFGQERGRRLRSQGAASRRRCRCRRARRVAPGQPALGGNRRAHSAPTCRADGQLDRAAMRARCSATTARAAGLEAIIHPRMRALCCTRAQAPRRALLHRRDPTARRGRRARRLSVAGPHPGRRRAARDAARRVWCGATASTRPGRTDDRGPGRARGATGDRRRRAGERWCDLAELDARSGARWTGAIAPDAPRSVADTTTRGSPRCPARHARARCAMSSTPIPPIA